MSYFKGSERIEILGYEIIHLISAGYKENVEDIIDEMSNENLMTYLLNKYRNKFFAINDDVNSPYNLSEWEKVLDEYSYISFNHDVVRKMGIMNKDEGLLMLLSIVLEIVSNRK